MTEGPAPSSTSLAGWRVLVPRAPGRGAGLARLVEQAGGTAVVAPLVSRAEIGEDDRAALDAAVTGLQAGRVAWVAVTSVNAVEELVASAERVGAAERRAAAEHVGSVEREGSAEHEVAAEPAGRTGDTALDDRLDVDPGPLARAARRARWAAVGPATARALTAVGVHVDLVATENSAVGLLAEWPKVPLGVDAAEPDALDSAPPDRATPGDRAPAEPGSDPPRVLLPLGDLARPTLEVGLRECGYEPLRVTTYRTVSHPAPQDVVEQWRAGGFDAVVLTSGSVAREVAQQLGPRTDVRAVAIGEPTRRAAVETGQTVAAVARTADDDGLLAALAEAHVAALVEAHLAAPDEMRGAARETDTPQTT